MSLTLNKVYQGDCMELMKDIPNNYIDMILTDPPYGLIASDWDLVLPFTLLWKEYSRICKKDAVIVFTATQPFTTMLIASNIKEFKYCWYWVKNQGTNFFHAKHMPIRKIEEIVVFGGSKYNPQMMENCIPTNSAKGCSNGKVYFGKNKRDYIGGSTTRYPVNVLSFPCVNNYSRLHPSQKPVELFEYLVKTYTDEGNIVLDNTAGVGTTGIACQNTGRNFLLIEKDVGYCEIAINRIEENKKSLMIDKIKT